MSRSLQNAAVGVLACAFSFAQWVGGQTALSIANAPGYPGATVPLPIAAQETTNMTAAQFDVTFNPVKVAAGGLVSGAVLSNHVVRSREIAPGVRRVLVYSSLNRTVTVTNQATLASLAFTVPATEYVGSGPITLSKAVLARPDATAITPVALSSGAIFVRPVNQLPNGSVQFFLPSIPDQRYLIQATTDFLSWVNITNTTALGDFMDLVDTDAARYPHRFYRWVLYNAAGEIGAVTQLPGGRLRFQLSGLAGRTYVLQASADLQHWTDLSTNVATSGTLNFTNMIDPAFPKRFFRLKSQ